MFTTIHARNVNDALEKGLEHLESAGIRLPSRNGTVLKSPGPVVTVYRQPTERVLFSPLRDANPFFHLYECVWMMAGRNDVGYVAQFAKQMEAFSDDGHILWGAYGYRWRNHFGFDQIAQIAADLNKDYTSRREVLAMWDAGSPDETSRSDLIVGATGGKDIPCNTHIYFDGAERVLNMTVCNRSNDIVWGAYGANAVHMSLLHEVMSMAVGMPVGLYYQFSNNYHAYIDRPDVQRLLKGAYKSQDQYRAHLTPASLALLEGPTLSVKDRLHWLSQFCSACEDFVAGAGTTNSAWVERVVRPMMKAHAHYKAGEYQAAIKALDYCAADDWASAGRSWLMRRHGVEK